MSEIAYEVVSSAPTDAIVGLYQAGGWWDEDPANRSVIPQMIRGSFCFLVAREGDGRIVGMGRVISDGVSDAYIQDVVVLESHRGRGIGREIVRRLTERCLEARIGWVGLVAEPGTRAFYEPLGFRALAGYEPMLHGGGTDGR
jgi:aralkylamine N-acetyltransferase